MITADAILSCADALNIDEIVQSTYVDLDNHITVYLDFNVYQRYEDDNKVRKFLKALIQQEDVDIIYSDTHLEEILRMGQKSYEIKRLNSIQELTKSKIAIVGNNQKIAVRILDIEKRFHQVAKYVKINAAAEERECILAEAGEHLCLNEFNEQQNKAIGSSSLREIISNVNKNGKKRRIIFQMKKISIRYFDI